ncbi:MAG: PD-(D/E)XK nuclease-like domain-containing protein [Sulfuritalea sp.]|nr:PD-(D/E)XK nuclease-like domain-containing protein [Sulfuritalea sp.]
MSPVIAAASARPPVASPLVAVPSPPRPIVLRDLFGPGELFRTDISHAVYHADRSCVSSTGLKKIATQSPAHYRDYLDGGPLKETLAMFLGTAIHARVLEPNEFHSRYVVAPISDKRTTEWKEFVIANADRTPLTAVQMEIIDGIAHRVSQHQSASSLLMSGWKEVTMIWQDEETGIWLKIRPDCLCVDFDTGICMDLKSTDDASPNEFARSCVKYNYDISAAMYLDGLRAVLKRDFDFAFLAAEKERPFEVALYGAPEEMLLRGQRRYREALRLVADCTRRNHWPGYQPDGDYEILNWPRFAL